MKKLICLGIESSCDETAAAIVDNEKNILSHAIYSQIPQMQKYGGVVPELAARAHIIAIDKIVKQALFDAGLEIADIDIIAGTAGPGLIGGVIVGWEFAMGLSQSTNKPLIAVNHLEAHALIPRLTQNLYTSGDRNRTDIDEQIEFPYIVLLASGGHTQILIVHGVGQYEILGETLDDSAGEAFDKVAKMLNLGYPGGPIIEEYAKMGNPNAYQFPRPLCNQNNCNFSFSGIKTTARTMLNNMTESSLTNGFGVIDNSKFQQDFCASFQAAVIDCIINRLTNAIARAPGIKTLVVAGGVAANMAIRTKMEKLAAKHNMKFAAPALKLCTDNGVMVAWAGIENYRIGNIVTEPVAPRPRWPLHNKT